MNLRRIGGLTIGVSVIIVVTTLVAFRVARPSTDSRFGRLPRGVAPTDLNVLLITLDTTRADRLGAYGAIAKPTPAFDRIAGDGVLFRRAVTAVPLTLPSHATMFTARYPPAHGVRDNGGFFLDAGETTLAERLKANGFATGGFVGAYVLDRRWGIAQGFDTYFDEFDTSRAKGGVLASVERPGNEVADRALAWLEQVAGSRFFGWVHFYDAHSPYDPPEPYRSRFAAEPYTGEIAFVDSQIQRLLEFLDRRDLLKKTIVAIIGDHGESLGEHGERTHGFFIYQSVLDIPFAVLTPFDGLRGRRVAEVVRSVDLVPTLMDLLSMPLVDRVDGQSLAPLMSGSSGSVRELGLEAYAEAMYPRYHFGWSELRALTSGRFKYIDAPRPELYDLEQDPHELHNVYDTRRPLADRMAASLRSIAEPVAAAVKPPVEVPSTALGAGDPEARARLAALGYVGTFAGDAPRSRSTLADPKDKIELFNLITKAREELQDAHDSKAGLAMLEEAVRKDPEIVDAWLLMGNAYASRREFTRALQCFQRALALKPDYDLAVMNMANVYRDLGRPADAVVGLQRLLAINPNHLQARQQMAQIFLDEGQLADAERELDAVLRQDERMAAAHNSLGALRLKQGDTDGGEREIRRALADRPDLALAHFNLALVAERRGDLTSAEAEYRKEIEQHPGSYKAQFNLGKLYEQRGDRPGQLREYQQAVASNPQFAEGHLFLAKLYLDLRTLDEAIESATRGIELQPTGEWAPLGHFVLADAFAARGNREAAARERSAGERLAARSKKP
jgi:arylsulfatase A-like enzyme/tetratricopeptide (TPR) repeat protein